MSGDRTQPAGQERGRVKAQFTSPAKHVTREGRSQKRPCLGLDMAPIKGTDPTMEPLSRLALVPVLKT